MRQLEQNSGVPAVRRWPARPNFALTLATLLVMQGCTVTGLLPLARTGDTQDASAAASMPYLVTIGWAQAPLPREQELHHFTVHAQPAKGAAKDYQLSADRSQFEDKLVGLPAGPLTLTWTAFSASGAKLGSTSFKTSGDEGWSIGASERADGVELAAAKMSMQRIESCDQAYQENDLDHDGGVTLAELLAANNLPFGAGPVPEDVRGLVGREMMSETYAFLQRDANGDGRLSHDEACGDGPRVEVTAQPTAAPTSYPSLDPSSWPFPLPAYPTAPFAPRPTGQPCKDEVCGGQDTGGGTFYDPLAYLDNYKAACEADWIKHDTDHSGSLSFAEWQAARGYAVLTSPALPPEQVFRGLDTDQDGQLSPAELCASFTTEKPVPLFPTRLVQETEPNDDRDGAMALPPGVTANATQKPSDVDNYKLDLPPGAAGHVVVRFIKAENGGFNMHLALSNVPAGVMLASTRDSMFEFDLAAGQSPVFVVRTEQNGVIDNPSGRAVPYRLAYYLLPPTN